MHSYFKNNFMDTTITKGSLGLNLAQVAWVDGTSHGGIFNNFSWMSFLWLSKLCYIKPN